jgi:hypothetical protein
MSFPINDKKKMYNLGRLILIWVEKALVRREEAKSSTITVIMD